ncbi:hypothetical protein ACPCHQ_11785 [Ralstonia thomasii]|jgi:hypothetical protein|uniref:Uncharacterized protein n=2 Tax=Ralstonia TaxID=48736 RepID=A0ABN9ISZ1_9RALS|nr:MULTISPECIES: hypothetical protein [Ralstonia]MBT2177752.1 hypothetical protein [Ralstonia pickettii]CAJ0710618.1 hypothetical protein LMG7143_01650 [Ralstonia sp. LMG 18095]CAJ0792137.1 hypothetical protein LMG18095_02272 [Ralstonia sp. LMG 18095]
MKTIEIKGWIFAEPNEWDGTLQYKFSSIDYEAWAKNGDAHYGRYTKVAEHTIVAEVKDDVDPAAAMIKALEAEREALRAAFTLKVASINEKISKLQALPFNSAEVVEA